MNVPNTLGVDPFYATVTLIQYPGVEDHATGFYFKYDDQDFLITNRHVVDVVDSNEDRVESIRIFTRKGPHDLTSLRYHDVDLVDDKGDPTWLVHPEEPQIDVVAIPLETTLGESIDLFPVSKLGQDGVEVDTGSFAFTTDNFRPEEVIVGAGEQAMIMGYPIRGTSPYYPVCRDALIATPYGVGLGFGTDVNMHPGTSGSPVLTHRKAMQQTTQGNVIGGNTGPFLIGVHSGDLSQFNDVNQLLQSGPLNLNTAWHAELLTDICSQ